MSTVKAVNFQHPSATQSNLVLAADGTVSGGLPSANRNLLYNGAMQVAQRGTSSTGVGSASGYFTADRWQFTGGAAAIGTWTQDIQNDAPTGSGFRRSLRMLCTTANVSPTSLNATIIAQQLEGQDLQRIAKGTSSAQQLTLSFWVKSNTTGTYVAWIYDGDNARGFSASYSVSASAAWEKKMIAIPADLTGAFDNDNASSLTLNFMLAAGSGWTSGTMPTAWAGDVTANRAVGQTNLAAAINNYWQVTGVQLEVGPVASAFEFKSYGQELRECQRYFHVVGGLASTSAWTTNVDTITFPRMRVSPTSVTNTVSTGSGAVFTALSDSSVYQSTGNSAFGSATISVSAEL